MSFTSLITLIFIRPLSAILLHSPANSWIARSLNSALHKMGVGKQASELEIKSGAEATCQILDKDNVREFIDSFDNVLTDCDGVLWNGKQPIEGSSDAVDLLKNLGKNVFYVTNNSTETRKNYVEKCQKHGFPATEESIYCTANAVAGYLKKLNFNKTAYVIGSKGLADAFDEVGIKHVGTEPDPMPEDFFQWYQHDLKLLPNIGAVVVGLDFHVSFPKLMKAASYLKDPDCVFIASNMDTRFPMRINEFVVPGTGTIVSAVKAAAGREPIVIGKPNVAMFEAIAHEHRLDPSRTLMIGDRLDTDIVLGSRCGLKTLFVLTGISTLDEVDRCKAGQSAEDKEKVPTFYLERLGDLVDLLE